MNPVLRDVYLNTTYRVFSPLGVIDIKIGEPNEKLLALLEHYKKQSFAFITAYNPKSKLISFEENINRNNKLANILKLRGLCVFDGEGRGKDSNYMPEKSFLILGVLEKDAVSLSKQFEQNCILFGVSDGMAKLIDCNL